MVFDGEELLEFAVKSIRSQVDHISVTYQTTSYFGNKANPLPVLENLKAQGLIDELIFFQPNLKIHHKENELRLRNIGLEASRRAGCSHHISADVDEFYKADELKYAKSVYEGDFLVVPQEMYFKKPTWMVYPSQNLSITLIHPVDNEYSMNKDFPCRNEITRRFVRHEKYKILSKEEFTLHHMCYIRSDIRKKYLNSDNGRFIDHNFYKTYDNYQLGGRVCLLPEYINRKTIEVPNYFNINLDL